MKTTFCSKANRDAAARALKAQGVAVWKYSARAQRINPKYVADSGVSGPTQFGDELEFFSTLYMFEVL
jgi:hypothetical protein